MAPLNSSPVPEYRAGGTDLSERRRSGVSRGALIDVLPAAAGAGVAPEGAACASAR